MNAPASKKSINRAATHQVRIIAGQWKRTPLSVISAEGLRPTPDRVRETVFNWINFLIASQWETVRCLDVFAGSGALGFEAASRGAPQVLMLENHTPAFKQLETVKQKLNASQVQLMRADALLQLPKLQAQKQEFDLIFLDPPFAQGMLEKILPYCASLLSAHGLLYVEAEFSLLAAKQVAAPKSQISTTQQFSENPADLGKTPDFIQGWEILRSDKAGNVYFHLLQRSNSTPVVHEIQA